MSNALVKYLDDGQKDVIAMAYASFEPNMTGPVAFPLQQGIKGLLYELNKGCRGGCVAPFYLREKLEQIIGAIEDERQEVLAKCTPVRYHHREEDDGQPDEAKEWEDLEGPQEYDDPLDVSEV